MPVRTARGEVAVTVAYGGAIYASVDATTLGLAVDAAHYGELIARRPRDQVGAQRQRARRPPERPAARRDLRHDPVRRAGSRRRGEQVHQRNVTVFADGEVDRSPCGSGTCARLAVLAADGRVAPGGPTLRHESIVGSVFTGSVLGRRRPPAGRRCCPQVTGMAYRTGEHTFTADPADPLLPGFVLR